MTLQAPDTHTAESVTKGTRGGRRAAARFRGALDAERRGAALYRGLAKTSTKIGSVTRGQQVTETVDDHQVGDARAPGQLPLGLHPLQPADVSHDPPRLVVDHPAPAAVGV